MVATPDQIIRQAAAAQGLTPDEFLRRQRLQPQRRGITPDELRRRQLPTITPQQRFREVETELQPRPVAPNITDVAKQIRLRLARGANVFRPTETERTRAATDKFIRIQEIAREAERMRRVAAAPEERRLLPPLEVERPTEVERLLGRELPEARPRTLERAALDLFRGVERAMQPVTLPVTPDLRDRYYRYLGDLINYATLGEEDIPTLATTQEERRVIRDEIAGGRLPGPFKFLDTYFETIGLSPSSAIAQTEALIERTDAVGRAEERELAPREVKFNPEVAFRSAGLDVKSARKMEEERVITLQNRWLEILEAEPKEAQQRALELFSHVADLPDMTREQFMANIVEIDDLVSSIENPAAREFMQGLTTTVVEGAPASAVDVGLLVGPLNLNPVAQLFKATGTLTRTLITPPPLREKDVGEALLEVVAAGSTPLLAPDVIESIENAPLGPFASPLSHTAAFFSSPLGIAMIAIPALRGITLMMEPGAVGMGAVARQLKLGDNAQIMAEVFGGIAAPIAIQRNAGRLAEAFTRARQAGEEAVERFLPAPLKRVVLEELGGVKLPGEVPIGSRIRIAVPAGESVEGTVFSLTADGHVRFRDAAGRFRSAVARDVEVLEVPQRSTLAARADRWLQVAADSNLKPTEIPSKLRRALNGIGVSDEIIGKASLNELRNLANIAKIQDIPTEALSKLVSSGTVKGVLTGVDTPLAARMARVEDIIFGRSAEAKAALENADTAPIEIRRMLGQGLESVGLDPILATSMRNDELLRMVRTLNPTTAPVRALGTRELATEQGRLAGLVKVGRATPKETYRLQQVRAAIAGYRDIPIPPNVEELATRSAGNLVMSEEFPVITQTFGPHELIAEWVRPETLAAQVRPTGRQRVVVSFTTAKGAAPQEGLQAFKNMGKFIDDLQRANPDLELVAVPLDPRRAQVFQRAGFRPLGDEYSRIMVYDPDAAPRHVIAARQARVKWGNTNEIFAMLERNRPSIDGLRTRMTAEGFTPPPPPPPPPKGIPGLLPGSEPPSLSWWGRLEEAHFLSPEAGDMLRSMAEKIAAMPGGRTLLSVVASPSAIARVEPYTRNAIIYQRVGIIQQTELSQRMIKFYESQDRLWKLGIKPGTVMYEGREVAFRDIAESPSKFAALTIPQTKWIEDGWKLVDDLADQFEAVLGKKLADPLRDAIRQHYWPAFVLEEDGSVRIYRRLGAKQSPMMERVFTEADEAIAKGVAYAGPAESLEFYGRALQKVMRDELLVRVLENEGLIAKTTGEELAERIVQAEKMLEQAATMTPDDLAELQTKLRNMRGLQDALKMGTAAAADPLGPALRGFAFPNGEGIKALKKVLGPGNSFLRWPEMIAAVPRFLITGTMDVGHFFIQGLLLALVDPEGWAKAVYRSLESAAMPKHFYRSIAEHPAFISGARHGLGIESVEFMETIRPGGLLARVPLVSTLTGPITRSFDNFIYTGRVYLFDALMKAGRVAEGSAEAYRLANFVNTMLGTTSLEGLGISATQRQVERAFVFFSPRYTRSIFGVVGHAFGKGLPAAVARRALAEMLLGGIAVFVGVGKALGLSTEEIIKRLDPRAPLGQGKFLSLPIAGNEFGFGTSWRALFGFLGAMVSADSWEFDSVSEGLNRNPISQYIRSRTSPLTGGIWDFVTQEDFIGRGVNIDAFFQDPRLFGKYLLGTFAPMTLQAVVEARGGWPGKLAAFGVEAVGGRTFPESAWSLRNMERERIAKEGYEAKKLSAPSYGDLNRAEKAVVNTTLEQERPDIVEDVADANKVGRFAAEFASREAEKGVLEELVNEGTLGGKVITPTTQAEDNEAFLTGAINGTVWRERYRRNRDAFFTSRDAMRALLDEMGLGFEEMAKPTHPADIAIMEYLDTVPANYLTNVGEIDWDAWRKASDAAYRRAASLGGPLVAEFLRPIQEDETARRFKAATQQRFEELVKIPRYKFIDSVAEEEIIDNILTEAATARDMLSIQGTSTDVPTLVKKLLDALVKNPELATTIGVTANQAGTALLLSRTSTRKLALSNARDEYILAHPDVARFYPSFWENLDREEQLEFQRLWGPPLPGPIKEP